MTNIEKMNYIRQQLSNAELLAQLAEEAGELAHAALKFRRATMSTNPTPLTPDECLAKLKEEFLDTTLVWIIIARCDDIGLSEKQEAKLDRWVKRLEART